MISKENADPNDFLMFYIMRLFEDLISYCFLCLPSWVSMYHHVCAGGLRGHKRTPDHLELEI